MEISAASLIALTAVLFGCGSGTLAAKELYVAQTAAGRDSGAACSDAYAVTWLDTSANWGMGSTQISPGDTVHLCGTFAGSPGATLFSTRGNGASGNPITIRFENNALLSAPYWSANGAIIVQNNYITIDGGTHGVIQNTLNGTQGQACPGGPCAYQQESVAVQANGASGLTVQNLNVTSFYMRQEGSTTDTTDVDCLMADSGDNVLFQYNTVDHCRIGFGYTNNTPSTTHGPGTLVHNTLSFVEHGITVATGSGGSILNGVSVRDNDFGGGAYLWDSGSPNVWHHDPIHMFSQAVGSAVNGVAIFNNYFHGIWSRDAIYQATHMTAVIFLEQIGPGATIFNNIIDLTQGGVYNQPSNGDIFCKGSGSDNCRIYNNTFVDTNDFSEGFQCSSNAGHDIRNNIFYNTDGFYAPAGCTIAASDHNDFYLTTGWSNNGSSYNSLAAWRTVSGFDASSIATAPGINLTTYVPGTGAPVLSAGANFSSLGIPGLNADKVAVARPGSGPWDIGALQGAQGSVPVIPNPPTALVLTVK